MTRKFEMPDIPGVIAIEMNPDKPRETVESVLGVLAAAFRTSATGLGHKSVCVLDKYESFDALEADTDDIGRLICALAGKEERPAARLRFTFRKEAIASIRSVLAEIDRIGVKVMAANDFRVANDLAVVRRALCVLLSGEEWIAPDDESLKRYSEGLEERRMSVASAKEPAPVAPAEKPDPDAGKPAWIIEFKKPAQGSDPAQQRDYGVRRGLTLGEAIEKLLDEVHPYAEATPENEDRNRTTALDRVELRRWLVGRPAA